jgi:5-methylcytosine-specific restriction enzyme A
MGRVTGASRSGESTDRGDCEMVKCLRPNTLDIRRTAPVATERIGRQRQVKRLYDNVRWRKARAMFLKYNPLCVMCEKRGETVVASIVDHITPHNGDSGLFWDPDNWMALCPSCHSGWKRQLENKGYTQACDVNGMPTDDTHIWNKKR